MSVTPILDRQQTVPAGAPGQRMSRLTPGFVLAVVVGVVLGGVVVRVAVCIIVSVMVHELGHLVAGFLAGFEFRYIVAGPLVLSKQSRGLHFDFLPRRLLGGGCVQMVPGSSGWSRRRELVLEAGGPVATALLFLPVVMLPWSPLTACLLIANTLIAVVGWIPIGGRPNDARMLLNLKHVSEEKVAAMAELWQLDRAGVEPRNWPRTVVDRLAAVTDDIACRVPARQYSYIYLRDSGHAGQIAAALELVLACAGELPPVDRRNYFAEAAFYQAEFARNTALAREWLDDARKVTDALPGEDWEPYPLAAIALAEGDQVQARRYLARAIAALDRHPGKSGSVASVRARLVSLQQAAAQ